MPSFPVLISDLPETTCETGPFQVSWAVAPEGGYLTVRHRDSGDRPLWETRPGEAFLIPGTGDARVRESRGFFKLKDRVVRSDREQVLISLEHDGSAVVATGRLGDQTSWALRFTSLDDVQLRFDGRFKGAENNRIWLRSAMGPDEDVFGFGTQFTELNMRGRRVPILSQEPGIGRGIQPLTWLLNRGFGAGGAWHNTNAPAAHYLTSEMRSLSLENHEHSVFDLRQPGLMEIQVWAPTISGRIYHGDSPLELVEAHTRFAGRMPPLPSWMNRGAVIGLQGGPEKAEGLLADLERHDAPVSAMWLQDWVGGRKTAIGSQLWWNWEVDPETYPDWNGLVQRLRHRDVRVMTYINPFLVDAQAKGSVERNLYQEALEAGYLVRDASGAPYPIMNTDFAAALVDLTHPEARIWLKEILRTQLLGSGASGWMADFGEALPFDAVLSDGTDAATYHNRYPEDWAQLNREVLEEEGLVGEVVFFTRSGFTRSPGQSTLFWLGDQLTAWRREDGLASAVIGLLSSGLSGFSLNHGDVGGYTATTMPRLPLSLPLVSFSRDRELLQRWAEMCAFTAVFRTHEGNQPGRNHQIGDDEETLAHFARFSRVYAALGPYREELFAEAAERGAPVVRHMWLQYPEERAARNLEGQFMLGSEILVAPTLSPGAVRTSLYLPPGDWVHLWSGATCGSPAGGRAHHVASPVGEPAVFYRASWNGADGLRQRLSESGDLPRIGAS